TKWSESDLYLKMTKLMDGETPETWSTKWDVKDSRAQFLQFMTKFTTYGYPGYNNFAKVTSSVSMEAHVDKFGSYSDDASSYIVNPSGKLMMGDELVSTISPKDLSWVKSITELADVREKNIVFNFPSMINFTSRSEERRVGKECRCREARDTLR